MVVMPLIVACLAALGHLAICIFLNNRWHATGHPRQLIKAVSCVLHPLTYCGAAALAVWCYAFAPWGGQDWTTGSVVLAFYATACIAVAVGPLPVSLWQRRHQSPAPALLSNDTTIHDCTGRRREASFAGVNWRRWMVGLPGNEALRLHVHEKRLIVPRLDPELEGLTIAHLSDLHYTGAIGRGFFEEVVRLTNDMRPDLVAVTGDLLDCDRCLEWVPYTLGRLRATYGAYFVLGNHDLRVDWRRLRETLEDAGVIDLGGRWTLTSVRDCPIVLAGNELPWFRDVPDLGDCPDEVSGRRPLRILLSHSPDQFEWGRQRDFDLLLAGHTHGGQIRLPGIGPVYSPSRYGVRYASGLFHAPPTLMHVSRGLSGKTPLRYNCPPELSKLVLTRAEV